MENKDEDEEEKIREDEQDIISYEYIGVEAFSDAYYEAEEFNKKRNYGDGNAFWGYLREDRKINEMRIERLDDVIRDEEMPDSDSVAVNWNEVWQVQFETLEPSPYFLELRKQNLEKINQKFKEF